MALSLDVDAHDKSVWKPLVGPNNRRPLAACDFVSNEDGGIIDADVSHADRVGENALLLPNRQHRCDCVEDQHVDELIVFRNIDSSEKRASESCLVGRRTAAYQDTAGGFHGAVQNRSANGRSRTSVEVRFVAFR